MSSPVPASNAAPASSPVRSKLVRSPALLRVVAIVEAVSWLALIVATIVKYAADAPLGVKILGPVHGVLFLIYVGLTILVRFALKWDVRTTLVVLGESLLPGGGFLAARRADLRAA